MTQALDISVPAVTPDAKPVRRPITSPQLRWGVTSFAVVLSAASLFVVWQGAADEPYFDYRRYDAIVQLGLGTALIALWGVFGIAVATLVFTRRLSPAWLMLLLWVATAVFYLGFSPLGYLADLNNLALTRR